MYIFCSKSTSGNFEQKRTFLSKIFQDSAKIHRKKFILAKNHVKQIVSKKVFGKNGRRRKMRV